MAEADDETFPDGVLSLVPRWEKRRAPFRFAPWEELPAADADLAAIAASTVAPIPTPLPKGHTRYGTRVVETAAEFVGDSGLCLLNALLIMNLRKKAWPDRAPALFHRIWDEHPDLLLERLNGRWLISSIITFADHGQTDADRKIGRSMAMFFSLMKLYEAERLFSGLAPGEPFDRSDRVNAPLPMEMEGFSLLTGDLEANLLAPLLVEAAEAPVAGPLALLLLERLNADPGTLFRRLKLMRDSVPPRDKSGKDGSGKTADPG